LEDKVKIALHIHPRAARNQILGFVNNTWRLKIAALPAKGEAYRELVSFLSVILGIPKSSMDIVSGHTARHKIMTITGLPKTEITKRLLLGVHSRRKGGL
jgi:uncharacterized protein (TIGR00251 family)